MLVSANEEVYQKICLVVYRVFLTKSPTGRQPGFLHLIPKFDTPMHTLHIDHLGLFVLSKRRNAYLIVAIDGFTKFVFLRAVRSTQRSPVLRFLEPEGSIPNSQELSTCSYPEPD
jgi:hypothetical protein